MREISTITIQYSDAEDTRLDSMLRVLGEVGRATTWKVRSVECVGAQADRLHAVSDSGSPVHGTDLAEIASGVDQVIDGEFRAYGAGEEEAWLVLRAVDSTSWDVASPREDVLDRFRAAYEVFEAGKMDWGP